MTRKIRLTILAFSIICFFIIAPLAILYGWGYRYDLKNKTLIQTGAIYLKSVPSKASVLLNGEEWKKKTPLIIDGLLPKEYSVEVKLEGFHSWQKILEVKPTLVTEAKNILLVPENPLITALENKSEIKVKEILLSPNKKELAFSFCQEGSSGIWILDLNQKDEVTLIDNKLLALPINYDDFVPLEWSVDSNKLLFSTHDSASSPQEGKTKEKLFFIVDLENLPKTALEPLEKEDLPTTTGFLNLTSIIKDNPLKLRWHGQNSNILFYLIGAGKESFLFQLDLTGSSKLKSLENKAPQIIAKGVIDFIIAQDNIYTIKKVEDINGNKYIIYKNNFELAEFPEELGIPKKLFVLEKRGIVIETQEDRIYLLILRDNNPLLNNNPSFFLLTKHAKEVKLSPDKDKILYWQEENLKIYFLQKNISYKKEVGDIETISLDSPADEVLWYKDSEHLIYTQGGTTRITEIDPRSERNDVIFTEAEILIYEPDINLLYFINKADLYKVKFPTKAIY